MSQEAIARSFTVFETPLKCLIFKSRSCRVLFSFYYTALNAFENDLFNSFIATVSCGPVEISLRDFISAILTTDFLLIIFYFQSKVNGFSLSLLLLTYREVCKLYFFLFFHFIFEVLISFALY